MFLLYLAFTLLFQGANAVYCSRGYGIFSSRFYCSDYCCGNSCCYYTFYWGTGRIAGAAIGGIIGVCLLTAFVILMIKICCVTSGSRGRVLHTGQTNVFAMTAVSGQTTYPTTQPVAPPPYPGTGGAYPTSYPQPGMQAKAF